MGNGQCMHQFCFEIGDGHKAESFFKAMKLTCPGLARDQSYETFIKNDESLFFVLF